jgi:G protein-coupled receptor 157
MLPFVLYDLNLENLEVRETLGGSYSRISDTPDQRFSLGTSIVHGPFFNKHIALRITVGVVCCLSMLGATLIILSYFLVRDVQTKSRKILVQLSVADFGVACSNFIGVTVYFDQYIRHCPTSLSQDTNKEIDYGWMSTNSNLSCSALKNLCKTQAFFAGYSTLASVLWTLFLAVYIYCLVVHSSKGVHHKVLHLAYLLCWGVPLFVSLWLVSTGKRTESRDILRALKCEIFVCHVCMCLIGETSSITHLFWIKYLPIGTFIITDIDHLGYSPHGGSGWCTLKVDDSSGRRDMFAVVFGNDLWIYLTFIMVTLLYFTTHCYIKFQVSILMALLFPWPWVSLAMGAIKRDSLHCSKEENPPSPSRPPYGNAKYYHHR